MVFTNKDHVLIDSRKFIGRRDLREIDGGMKGVEGKGKEGEGWNADMDDGLQTWSKSGWGHVSSWFL